MNLATSNPTPAQPASAVQTRLAFAQARAAGLRHRDAAAQLGLSEGQALAAFASAEPGDTLPLQVRPLAPRWADILSRLQACGPLMALTRNEHVVHEKIGAYGAVEGSAAVGLIAREAIDLRLFFRHWHVAFAVNEPGAGRDNTDALSIQFFDRSGTAVHKAFAVADTDRAALQCVINDFAQADHAAFDPVVASPRSSSVAAAPVDTRDLAAAWGAMHDTHEFFDLLKRFGVERAQAFTLMQGRYTHALRNDALTTLLQTAARQGTPIMCFVANPGCIQIHSGPVKRIVEQGPWINVLDADFNLHLRQDAVRAVWRVDKPTDDGIVTSVEAFDQQGDLIVMFFGVRKPGQPEDLAWRALAHGLQPISEGAVAPEVA